MKVRELIERLHRIADQEREVIHITDDGERQIIEFVDEDEHAPDVEVGQWARLDQEAK